MKTELLSSVKVKIETFSEKKWNIFFSFYLLMSKQVISSTTIYVLSKKKKHNIEGIKYRCVIEVNLFLFLELFVFALLLLYI